MKQQKTNLFRRVSKFLLLSLILTLCFMLVAHAEESVITADTWKSWFESTALPIFLALLSVVAITYLENLPLMMKIKKASGKFESSAADVNAIVEASIEFKRLYDEEKKEHAARIAEYEAEILKMQQSQAEAVERFIAIANEYETKLLAMEERLTPKLEHTVHCADKIEKMVYLGFTNQCEMVKNGCARKIAEVEEERDET